MDGIKINDAYIPVVANVNAQKVKNAQQIKDLLVEQAAKELLEIGIDCEIIDIQSLLPFDINQDIAKSILDEVEEYSPEDNISKIDEKIINASNSMAAKNVAELSESGESKEFFQQALDVEKSTKNRKSVIAAITKHI